MPLSTRDSVRRHSVPHASLARVPVERESATRRVASNFVALSLAEVACRGTAMAVTFTLAARFGRESYGKIEFAFQVVFWLVLLVRDGLEVMAAREIARHPRLIRPLVDHLLALKSLIALILYAGLIGVGWFSLHEATPKVVLALYGLMLFTTALGLDYVYRGTERMGLVAVSLVVRTLVYAVSSILLVTDATRLTWVPALLVVGEVSGIAMVWGFYIHQYAWPRPSFGGGQLVRVLVWRGKSVYLIQIAQAVIASVDVLVVGLISRWADVGLYGAPNRISMALLTFGLIFQQVVLPRLSRTWRGSAAMGRKALDAMVRTLMMGLIPLAVGATILAGPIIQGLLQADFAGAELLVALGVWRAPLLALAFLYQTALIASNREQDGGRMLAWGAVISIPLVALFRWSFGLAGAAAAVLVIGFGLTVAGYLCLARVRRQPKWHHHVAKPLVASLAMLPVCRMMAGQSMILIVVAGAISYAISLAALRGINRQDLRVLFGHDA